ncbi:dCTP deaminase [Thermoplasma sp.]|uniref:dCTP deaminase n=1 Tax=Thermoplasma sp. TaxID=1973142 RepID=UPI001279B1E0|nr:dCTP deaminase [Thermoplasma sp.]KAA8923488.1 MAG: dCTP deaminase [Thermoplasma sp.]
MILNDGTIMRMVGEGFLISENFDASSLTPNGYDLRVDVIDIQGKQCTECEIKPMRHFLVSTIEILNMPEDTVGMIWTRSTFARKGIIGSFGAIDAGYHGNLTLSFFNAGIGLNLKRGERIAQIVFMKMNENAERPYHMRSGNYQHSRGLVREPQASNKDGDHNLPSQ